MHDLFSYTCFIYKIIFPPELSSDEYGMSYDDLKNYAISPATGLFFLFCTFNEIYRCTYMYLGNMLLAH